MTVTKLHASGYEPLAETIRYLIASHWTESLEPVFMSPNGLGTAQASDDKNYFGNSWRKFTNRTLIRLYNGNDTTLVRGRYFSEMQTTVFIDAFARNDMQLAVLTDEVNRIIFENQANVNTRIPTSGQVDSSITGFVQNVLSWVYPNDLGETGASVQAAAELDCKWQVHLT